jgi:hypothetical protein
MSGVWKRTAAGNLLLCGLAAVVVIAALANSASAIHRRGRIAHGSVAGADVIAYDRSSCGLAPGVASNPVGFGFGGYNYGGYPLYGYAQYLPAAYDGYGAVGYSQALPVGLPGGYGSGVGVTANLGAASAEACLTAFAPIDGAASCPTEFSAGAYRHTMRRMCDAMARLTWVYLPLPIPLWGCYGDMLGAEAGGQMIEGIGEGANEETLPAETVQPQSDSEEPMPEGARLRNKTLSIDGLSPETLEEPTMTEEGPSLRFLLEREL